MAIRARDATHLKEKCQISHEFRHNLVPKIFQRAEVEIDQPRSQALFSLGTGQERAWKRGWRLTCFACHLQFSLAASNKYCLLKTVKETASGETAKFKQ